jgi:hypothetical protein
MEGIGKKLTIQKIHPAFHVPCSAFEEFERFERFDRFDRFERFETVSYSSNLCEYKVFP